MLGLVFDWAEKLGGVNMRKNVVFHGDVVLVVGGNEEELLRLSTSVAFSMQTKPWLMEVDLWMSFLNVGMEFLEGLDGVWMGVWLE